MRLASLDDAGPRGGPCARARTRSRGRARARPVRRTSRSACGPVSWPPRHGPLGDRGSGGGRCGGAWCSPWSRCSRWRPSPAAVGLGLPGLRLILGEPPASAPPSVVPSQTAPPGSLGSTLGLGKQVALEDVERPDRCRRSGSRPIPPSARPMRSTSTRPAGTRRRSCGPRARACPRRANPGSGSSSCSSTAGSMTAIARSCSARV